jgi:hypothetical protein
MTSGKVLFVQNKKVTKRIDFSMELEKKKEQKSLNIQGHPAQELKLCTAQLQSVLVT